MTRIVIMVTVDLVRDDLAALYPWFGIRVSHAGLVLEPPTDAELLELAAVVAEPGGVLAPGQEHFLTRPTGDAAAARTFLEHSWGLRRFPTAGAWRVPFAVLDGGRVVGHATLDDAGTPQVMSTTAFLARSEQGRGIGRRVRLMLLELAFAHLGAERAVTAAAQDNAASLRVSRRCGYRETHRGVHRDGTPEVHLAVTPGAWRTRRLSDVVVDGVGPFRETLSPA
jgi:RimJ/RimL family protein N-acetyltransferase